MTGSSASFRIARAEESEDSLRQRIGVDRIVTLPAGLASKADLLNALGVLLQFPEWSGRNYDALADLLRDLSWLDDCRLMLRHEDVPLTGEERRKYLAVLHDAVEAWRARGEPRFEVSFPSLVADS